MDSDIFALLERKLQNLLTLLDLPATKFRIFQKHLEPLIGKLRSMHLEVPGAVAHLYHI